MAFINVLHTNSKYGYFSNNLLSGITNDSEAIIRSRFMSAINNLENKEKNFYRQFGFDSAEAFFRAIHNLLSHAGKDLEILQKFNATNLKPILAQFKNPLDELNNFYLVVNTEQARVDLTPILKELAIKNETVKITVDGKLAVSAKWDLAKMKQLASGVQRSRNFNERSNSTDALLSFLRETGKDLIQVYPDDKHINHNDRIDFRSGPFNYGAKEIRNMDPQRVTEIQNRIKDFIFQSLGVNSGSSALIKAADTVWNQIINKIGVNFFVGGEKSWQKNVLGALGEFQTAMFFQYFAYASSNPTLAQKITDIIGSNKNKAGQMLHTDVSILEAFGIQVKNYDGDVYKQWYKDGSSMMVNKKIQIRLHPMQIPTIMSDLELRNYVINSYFNRSFGPPSDAEWNTFFENHADEVLNLAGYNNSPDPNRFANNIGDKITFYMISGHFIPGSVIMRGAMEQKLNVSQTKVSASPQYTNEDYLAHDSSGEARLLKWWKYKEGVSPAQWENTDENKLSTWDAKISIRTTFEYQNIINSLTGGMYKLF